MGTLVYIMKLPALHSSHVLRFFAILIFFSTIINARAQHIEDDDFYEPPERRSGGMSMMRLRKSDEDIVRNDLKDLLYKRAMSMMRLRRTPPSSWERQIRGPSMMRLKKSPALSGSPNFIIKDLETNMCNDYPDLC